jgi:hypothetical protein
MSDPSAPSAGSAAVIRMSEDNKHARKNRTESVGWAVHGALHAGGRCCRRTGFDDNDTPEGIGHDAATDP